MIAVDTNILVYAHRAESPFHAAALRQLTQLAEGTRQWAIPVFCVTEFLRVVTHPRICAPPSTMKDALGFIHELMAAPACRIALPDEAFIDELESCLHEGNAKGNLVFDAQIAALCRQKGIETLLTQDRDFTRFPNLQVLPLSPGIN